MNTMHRRAKRPMPKISLPQTVRCKMSLRSASQSQTPPRHKTSANSTPPRNIPVPVAAIAAVKIFAVTEAAIAVETVVATAAAVDALGAEVDAVVVDARRVAAIFLPQNMPLRNLPKVNALMIH